MFGRLERHYREIVLSASNHDCQRRLLHKQKDFVSYVLSKWKSVDTNNSVICKLVSICCEQKINKAYDLHQMSFRCTVCLEINFHAILNYCGLRCNMNTVLAFDLLKVIRWLDTVFQGQCLSSLSINYVAINKVLKTLPPQLYQIKMKICRDQGCNDIGVVIATK